MSKSADFRAATAAIVCTEQPITKPEGAMRRTWCEIANQIGQLGGFEVGLPDLDKVDACRCRGGHLLTKQVDAIVRARPHRRTKTAAIGDQA
jgi:hypothetical protein